MKIAAYEVRPDEKPVIEGLCKKYGIELISTPANLDKTTAHIDVYKRQVRHPCAGSDGDHGSQQGCERSVRHERHPQQAA